MFQGASSEKSNNSSGGSRGKIAEALNGFLWSLKKAVFHNSILNKANVTTAVASTPSHVAKCKKVKFNFGLVNDFVPLRLTTNRNTFCIYCVARWDVAQEIEVN